jgi:predicted DNA-binding ribbon-helix-helix protein
MSGKIRKRSVVVAGHPTSVSLEPAFWDALKELANDRGLSTAALIAEIDRDRSGNLSSAIRVHVLDQLRRR